MSHNQTDSGKHYCKACAVWVENNPISLKLHNDGKKHQEKVQAATLQRIQAFTKNNGNNNNNTTKKEDSSSSTKPDNTRSSDKPSTSGGNRFAAQLGVYANKDDSSSSEKTNDAKEDDNNEEHELFVNPQIKVYLDYIEMLTPEQLEVYSKHCEATMGFVFNTYIEKLKSNLHNAEFVFETPSATTTSGVVESKWEEVNDTTASSTTSLTTAVKKHKPNTSISNADNGYVQLVNQIAVQAGTVVEDKVSADDLTFKKKKRKNNNNLSFDEF